MTTIQIYDPALCCSTGVCGVDVDQALVSFSADADWARQNGVQIERFNLAQQPMAFAENTKVKTFLDEHGQEGLPLILVNGDVTLTARYPTRDELAAWISKDIANSLFTEQVAELVAIGAAIAANCEPRFKHHYNVARKLGVSHEDMRRAVDLAQKVKDSPARTLLDLASRYLDQGPTPTQAKPVSGDAKGSACCGTKSDDSGPSKTGCC